MNPLSITPLVNPALDHAALQGGLAALFDARLHVAPHAQACVYFDARRQTWFALSWSELARRSARFGAALQAAGLRAGDRVAVQLPNGPDWVAADWAIQRLGLVTVALFADETPAGAATLLADCDARCLFTRDLATWTAISERARLPALRCVVPLRGSLLTHDRRVRALPSDAPVDATRAPAADVAPHDLATLVYTSGATGVPKAVMLSHRNLLSNAAATVAALGLHSEDRLCTHLPLAHLFGRTVCVYGSALAGASLVFGRGASSLVDDLCSQQPTVLVGVPRVFERLYGGWMQEIDAASPTRRALLRLTVDAGWAARHGGQGGSLGSRLLPAAWVRRFSRGLQQRLGGRLRLAVSGGAALSPQIGRVFTALGVPLLQGYGLTEAGPVVSVDRVGDSDPASCGTPLAGVETRIEASGELLLRGPSVMLGYWRDPEATRTCLDEAGWLRTGDKVSRLDTDRIYLTGRIKELLITATGEKVSPSQIESRLRELSQIDQVMVVGEARPFLTALIVPQSGPLAMLRAELGLNDGDDSAAARQLIEEALLLRCQTALLDAPRNHWIVRVALIEHPWTQANGLLTATHKLRRGQITRALATEIDRLYRGHWSVPATDASCNAIVAP